MTAGMPMGGACAQRTAVLSVCCQSHAPQKLQRAHLQGFSGCQAEQFASHILRVRFGLLLVVPHHFCHVPPLAPLLCLIMQDWNGGSLEQGGCSRA